jgi:hypothetical protein
LPLFYIQIRYILPILDSQLLNVLLILIEGFE